MAEEQVMIQALVFDSCREKIAKILKNKQINIREELFCRYFIRSCWSYFKMDMSDLRKITDDEEILALEYEIYMRTERTFKIIKYFYAFFGLNSSRIVDSY